LKWFGRLRKIYRYPVELQDGISLKIDSSDSDITIHDTFAAMQLVPRCLCVSSDKHTDVVSLPVDCIAIPSTW
jgi:hypothetical protein